MLYEKAFFVFVCCLALSACSSIRSYSDQSGSLNLLAPGSFTFAVSEASIEDDPSAFLEQRMRKATRQAMEGRGFEYSPQAAQYEVHFASKLRTRVRAESSFSPLLYRRRFGYSPLGLTRTELRSYERRSFHIQIRDKDSAELLWSGWAFRRERSRGFDYEQVNRTIEAILAKLPVEPN